jgi:hypothetical protein
VLVPDALAGNVMPLEVWGVRDGERISHGTALALVRKGETVEATIVLDRLPCGVFCEPGEVACEGGGVATCEGDADGCLQWSLPEMCPADQPFCSGGVCGTVCANDCVAEQGTCTDGTTQRACGEFDNDSCLDYGPAVQCTGTEVCYSGRCALPCTHATTLSNSVVGSPTDAFAPVIVADATSTLHAVYSVASSRQLRYARKPRGGGWSAWSDIVSGDGANALGENPSLVTDKAGGVHLVAGGSAVIYAYRAPAGGWEVTTVESDAMPIGQASAIAITEDGNVYVVYYRSKDSTLRHGRKGTPWALEDVKTTIGQRCDLAVTGNTLHAVSFDATNQVWYSTQQAGGTWESVVIKAPLSATLLAAAGVSIVAGRDGTLHVAYSDLYPSYDDLRYLYRPSGGNWTTSALVIDDSTSTIGGFPDLAIDPFDRLHVAYRTTTTSGSLRYATKPFGSNVWALTPQPPPMTAGVAPSIAVDAFGDVHILSASTPTGGAIVETTRACQ